MGMGSVVSSTKPKLEITRPGITLGDFLTSGKDASSSSSSGGVVDSVASKAPVTPAQPVQADVPKPASEKPVEKPKASVPKVVPRTTHWRLCDGDAVPSADVSPPVIEASPSGDKNPLDGLPPPGDKPVRPSASIPHKVPLKHVSVERKPRAEFRRGMRITREQMAEISEEGVIIHTEDIVYTKPGALDPRVVTAHQVKLDETPIELASVSVETTEPATCTVRDVDRRVSGWVLYLISLPIIGRFFRPCARLWSHRFWQDSTVEFGKVLVGLLAVVYSFRVVCFLIFPEYDRYWFANDLFTVLCFYVLFYLWRSFDGLDCVGRKVYLYCPSLLSAVLFECSYDEEMIRSRGSIALLRAATPLCLPAEMLPEIVQGTYELACLCAENREVFRCRARGAGDVFGA
jgi:hypothetical protein